MQRAIWILLACFCAAQPAYAQESAGGGGSASGQTLGLEAEAAASVKPLLNTGIETPAPPSPGAAHGPAACPRATAIPGVMEVSPGQPVALYGVLDAMNGNQLTITTEAGVKMTIDAGPALKSGETTILVPKETLSVLGSRGADGTIHADVIRRAKGVPATAPECSPPG
ncbi:MAG: hypothetical protein ACREFP_14240 [Acetobacteraceae bacterium]